MSIEYVHVGTHADILASGRSVGPGERVAADELHLTSEEGPGQDQHLVDHGVLVQEQDIAGESNAEAVKRAQDEARAQEKAAVAGKTADLGGGENGDNA